MEYESKNSDMYTSVGDNELNSTYNETERESPFDIYNPTGEFYSVGIDETMGLKEKKEDVHGVDWEQLSFGTSFTATKERMLMN